MVAHILPFNFILFSLAWHSRLSMFWSWLTLIPSTTLLSNQAVMLIDLFPCLHVFCSICSFYLCISLLGEMVPFFIVQLMKLTLISYQILISTGSLSYLLEKLHSPNTVSIYFLSFFPSCNL